VIDLLSRYPRFLIWVAVIAYLIYVWPYAWQIFEAVWR